MMRTNRKPTLSRWTLLAALSASVLGASAQARPEPASPVRRDGHKLVRAHLQSQAQLNAMFELGAELWSCDAGVGPVDFVVAPAHLEILRRRGIRFDVLLDDVQAPIDAERARLQQPAEDGASWFDDFKTYPQVNDYLDTLVALRPDLATKLIVGTSIERRTIYGLRISGPPPSALNGPTPDPRPRGDKPAVIFDGCQHAREWIAVMVPMYIADQLVRQYDADPRIHDLVDQTEFFIIPIANPDGYEFTYAPGGDRLWRKNRRVNGGGSFGVDLNRNWSVDWNGGESTSTNPGSDIYVGTAAFSEPETAALRDFIAARPQIVGHVDFHSYGQLVLQPLAHTHAQPVDVRLVDQIDGIMNAGIFSINGLSYTGGTGGTLLYLASGAMRDWCLVERRVFGHTIELRNTSTFLLPPSLIMPTCTEAFEAALRMAEWVEHRVRFMFTSGQPATIEAGATTALQLEILPLSSGPMNQGTAQLHWRVGSSGAFAPTPLTALGGDRFQATLPAVPCGMTLEYYLEIESQSGDFHRSPLDAPASVHQAQALGMESIFHDTFQTALGWTATGVSAGAWQRGTPVNDPNWPYDPLADADGSGSCYLTQNTLGNSDVDNGSVVLTSPIIDMSNPGPDGVLISYDYFLRLGNVNTTDRLLVEINSAGGGGTWMEVARHNTDGSLNWRNHQVTQAQLTSLGVAMTSQMRVRFTANDATPQSMVEAGVDNFHVRRVMCSTPACVGDIAPAGAPNGTVDIDDLLAVINAWGAGAGNPADVTGDGMVNIDDLLAVINAWGACP